MAVEESFILIVGFMFTTAVAVALVYYLAAPGPIRREPHAAFTAAICYASSFFIILFFPADLATAFKSNVEIARGVYEGIWRFVYWNTQILSNVLVPMQQSYVQAGEFEFRGKMRRFGKENLWKLSAIVVVAVLGAIVIVAKFRQYLKFSSLVSLLIGLGNMYGLVFCVLLLGYGSVEMPRRLWHAGEADFLLRSCRARARACSERVDDAARAIAIQRARAMEAGRVLERQHGGAELLPLVDRILLKVPDDYDVDQQARLLARDAEAATEASWAGEQVTRKRLVDLHRNLKDASVRYTRALSEFNALLERAREASDVVDNAAGPPAAFRSSNPARPARSSTLALAEWWWKCRLRLPAYRAASVLFMLASGAVVWSEVTMFSTKTLSPFGRMISRSQTFGTIQLLAALPLGYMAACAYFTLSSLRIPRMYQLGPGRRTDPYCLLFHSGYVARISSSMCYNYINMLNLDPSLPITAFERIMGPALSFFGSLSYVFNIYFPILVAVFCGLTALPRRLLVKLRLSFLRPSDDVDEETLRDGASLIAQELARIDGKRPGGGRSRGPAGGRSASPATAYSDDRSAMAMLSDDREDNFFLARAPPPPEPARGAPSPARGAPSPLGGMASKLSAFASKATSKAAKMAGDFQYFSSAGGRS